MEVITIESESYKQLIEKVNSIADYIKNESRSDDQNLEEAWVDSYAVCNFLRISERTLQRLRSKGLISYSVIAGKAYYTIAEVKYMLKERLIKRGNECLDELIKNHKENMAEKKKK